MTKTKKRGTDLIDLLEVPSPRPGLVTCYGSGSPFKRAKGKLYLVQHGRNRTVSRALCVVRYYGRKCSICPHSKATISFTAGEADGS